MLSGKLPKTGHIPSGNNFTKSRFNPSGKKAVAPKTANQRKYIEAIQEHDLTFGIGPAGTGKSFWQSPWPCNRFLTNRLTELF